MPLPRQPARPAPGCSTDALILLKVLVHHGIPREQAEAQLPRLQAAMIEHFTQNAAQVRPRPARRWPGLGDLAAGGLALP